MSSSRPLWPLLVEDDFTEFLDRKQKNLEAIFDAAPLGMLLVNDRMRVVRANDTIRRLSGRGYPDIVQHDACQAIGCVRGMDFAAGAAPPDSCDYCRLRQVIQMVLTSGEPLHGLEVRPALGTEPEHARPWLSASVEPLQIDGATHVVVALNDVTDRKRAEEQLRETMEMKAQFISTVSHELRTPLTSIREAVIIVLDEIAGRLNQDQKRFLDIAKRNIDRLSRLIDDVLDFQKLAAGKMKFHLQANEVAAVVSEAYATMQPHAAKSKVDLAVEVQPGLPPLVCDSDRIMQVLTNLISNGIKFTPEDGRVRVAVQRRDDQLVIRVSDTGYGIPKEDLPKLFTQFFRVHRPGKEIKGTGLGLAIVHKIVTAHGGRIEVESEPDKGTTFTIFLPLAQPSATGTAIDGADRTLERILTGQQHCPVSTEREEDEDDDVPDRMADGVE